MFLVNFQIAQYISKHVYASGHTQGKRKEIVNINIDEAKCKQLVILNKNCGSFSRLNSYQNYLLNLKYVRTLFKLEMFCYLCYKVLNLLVRTFDFVQYKKLIETVYSF